ncbi:MAG: AAA family ATPase [Caulobacteraceae bacterium]
MRIERGYVVVSGAPGAGKSTLTAPLARRLGLPLIAKDMLKESLYDHIPPGADPAAWSKVLGGAAMELLWMLAGAAPAAMLEANFRPRSAYERDKLKALSGPLVEVYCRCPPALAAERYAQRHARGERHPTHPLSELPPDLLAEFDQPIALGPVVEADTTAPVDIEALALRVLAAFTATV